MSTEIQTIIMAVSIGFAIAGTVIGLFFWYNSRTHRYPKETPVPKDSPPEAEPFRPSKIMIANDMNHPLVEIEPFDATRQMKFEQIYLPSSSISKLSAMLQPASNILSNAVIGSGKYYMVTFTGNPVTLLQTKEGVYKAVAVGQNGKIQELGNVQQWTRGLAVTVAVWQVLAVITAQKFLSDINERLMNIEEGIADIKQFLVQERSSKITGNYEHLKAYAATIQNGSFTQLDCQTLDNQLESIERECSQITEHLTMELDDISSQMLQLSESDDFKSPRTMGGLDEITDEIKQSISKVYRNINELNLTFQVRTTTLLLKGSLPIDKHILEQRIDWFSKVIEGIDDKVDSYIESTRNHVSRIDAPFFSTTDYKDVYIAQRDVLDCISEMAEFSNNMTENLSNTFSSITERLQQFNVASIDPTSLIVEIDPDGNVGSIKQIK